MLGYDYYNPSVGAATDQDFAASMHGKYKMIVDDTKHPRMPWQDAQVLYKGE